MDNVTHTFVGLALSNTGLNRKTRYATLALVIAANLPDIDIVSGLWGSTNYLKYHRGITHSLIGVTVLAAALAGVIYWLGRKRSAAPSKPALSVKWLLLICWIGTLSHFLLDWTTAYGIRPFLPFSGRWVALDIEFIFDPVLLTILLAGLAIPALFRLVSEEMGGRKPGYRAGAALSLCGVVCLWGVRWFAHQRAVNMLDARTYQGEDPIRIGAFPTMVNPFAWTGVVETSRSYDVLPVNTLADELDENDRVILDKPPESEALDRALRTRTAEVFLDFARFPFAQTVPSDNGTLVTINDLRFYSPNRERHGFEVQILLNKNLDVVSQSFSFKAGND